MPNPPSLKFVSLTKCVQVLIQDASSDDDDITTRNASYITGFFETECFTAVSEEVLHRILKYHPEKLTNRLLNALIPSSVRELSLAGCLNVQLMGLVRVLKKCGRVNKLILTQCTQLIHPDMFTFIGLVSLPLTTLILELNNNVTDEVIHSVLKNAPSLSTLNVSMCQKISNKAFLLDEDSQSEREVSPNKSDDSYCCNLTSIDISGCRQLNTTAVKHITSLCGPRLKCIDISWTSCDCVSLLYLAGYTLPAILDILLTNKELQPKKDEVLNAFLETYREIRDLYVEQYGVSSLSGPQTICDTLLPVAEDCANDFDDNNNGIESTDEVKYSFDKTDKSKAQKTSKPEKFAEKQFSGTDTSSVDKEADDCNTSVNDEMTSLLNTNSVGTKDNVADGKSENETGIDKFEDVDENLKRVCDKCCFSHDTHLYKPHILSLIVNGINFVSRGFKLGQICLENFLNVNPCLQKLSIRWKGLTSEYFQNIVYKLKDLQDVELVECTMLQNEGITSLGENCLKCQRVNLRGVVFIDDVSLVPFLAYKNLQNFNLAESTSITDKILKLISEKLSDSLVSLNLSWCEEVTEVGINAICSNCPNLKKLKLIKCSVSDYSLKLLGETCKNMVELSAENSNFEFGLTDEGILSIANNFRYLKKVDISWNFEITDLSVCAIMRNCGELEEAILKGLKRISDVPFLPIISGCTEENREMFANVSPLPYRSTVYARSLHILDLDLCDFVNDDLCQLIFDVCRGTLLITNYYGQKLVPDVS